MGDKEGNGGKEIKKRGPAAHPFLGTRLRPRTPGKERLIWQVGKPFEGAELSGAGVPAPSMGVQGDNV